MSDHETIRAISAFSGLAIPGAHSGAAGITIAEHRNLGLAILTLRRNRQADFAASVSEAFGITLADGPRVSAAGDLSFIGIGPGTYLAAKPAAGWRLADDLRATLAESASVCDQSSGYGVLRLSGPHVRDVLAKGVPLDLHPSSFGPNDAAVTLASHVGVVLWQLDQEPTYDIAVSRSFAASFWDWLMESAAMFGLAVATPISL